MATTVYQHRRLDTNEIFYIGIGKTEKRAYSIYQRNRHWHHIVDKVGHKVEIVTTCETWEEACQIERYLIKYYGRRDLGLGNLVNFTDGGEGTVNRVVSDETRKKLSLASTGNINRRGQTHSEETKLKMSLAKKGKPSNNKGTKMTEEQKARMSEAKKGCDPTVVQGLLDTQTGVFYNSISEASFYYDIKRTTLNAMLKGQNPNKTNLITI